MYHFFRNDNDTGTNLVIDALIEDEKIPLFKAPLIIISTFLTHLFGGSAGREGAALQFGGSLGYNLGSLFHLNKDDTKIMTMSGMAAAFSALFGTPVAATFFVIELSNVGHMHYAALLPAVVSSMTSMYLARFLGVVEENFRVRIVPELTPGLAMKSMLLALAGAMVSILFCICIKQGRRLLDNIFKNPWFKVVGGGVIIVGLSMIFRSGTYNGAGMDVIRAAFDGKSPDEAFVLKIIFTAITLGAGYKGGEIVPTFFVGATFGCLYGHLTGYPTQLAAAMGIVALFCGVTNCPVASVLIAAELFGYDGMLYYLIAVAISYSISGYYGLYGAQRFRYSKFKYR
jgi:H+/Cl- antiporter ClcA